MAVQEQTPYIEYTANGVATSFALGFDCESKDHLIVLVDEIEPPIATWSLNNGNVVFTTAPAAGKKITAQRNTPFSRNVDYQSYNNSFRPQSVNGDFDRLWLKLQELGVADWLMKLYVDRLHQQQEQEINDLKDYVDDRDDELRAYLMEEIRKQGVALDQLDEYYNYLMQRLAQIAVDKGWEASFVVDASERTQQQINDGVNSVSDLAGINATAQSRAYAKGWHSGVFKGGGDFIAIPKGSSTPNNGTLFPSANPNYLFRRVNYYRLTAEMFGAKGDGVTDDSPAIQALFNFAVLNRTQHSNSAGRRTTYAYQSVELGDSKVYHLETPVNIPDFCVVKGNKAILKCPDGGRIFTSTSAYRIEFNDLVFTGDDVEAVFINKANTDNARYEFNNCAFSTSTRTRGKYAITITSQSSVVYLNGCDVMDAPNYLKTDNVDFCRINGGWINGYTQSLSSKKPENTCSIRNGSREMVVNRTVFIPEADSSGVANKNVRWFDNYGSLYLNDCHFGGENSGIPIVYQYLSSVSDTTPFTNYATVAFKGGQAAAGANRPDGALIVLMNGVIPGRFSFTNLTRVSTPLISSAGYDFNKTIDETDWLLRVAIYTSSSRTRMTQIKINYSTIANAPVRLIPAVLSPFIEGGAKQGTVTEPEVGTDYTIVDVLKTNPHSGGGLRASNRFKLRVSATGRTADSTTVFAQEKVYDVLVFWDAGANPSVVITQEGFKDTLVSGATGLGDTLVSVTLRDRSTTHVALKLTVLVPAQTLAVSWLAESEQTTVSTGAGAGVLQVRGYS